MKLAFILVLGIASPAFAQLDADVGDEAVEVDELEVIEVWGERPNKPFDRDTELRLSGVELAEQGVTDLADALDLVPELHVRQMGRGGMQADIRGARKGAVKVIIDGIPMDEPFYGTFDLSSIPVTDIEQIRVALSPSSPIDGAGGPGGVIEVHTRDAVGARMLRARGQGSGLHGVDLSATGRAWLGDGWAVRGSASATASSRDFDISMPDGRHALLDEDRRAATGALRFEWRRDERRRVVADVSAQHRSFVPPPGQDDGMDVLVVDGETTARAGISADFATGPARLHGRGYAQLFARDSTYFADASLSEARRAEHIWGNRAGVGLLVNRPHSQRLHLVASAALDTEGADVEDVSGMSTSGGRSTVGELAAGAQFLGGPMRIDFAGGVAVPVGVGNAPWPEAKLTVAYRPVRAVTFEAIGAHKGRLPTLRERFRSDIGNDGLGPELTTFGELAVKTRPLSWLGVRLGSFLRHSDGMIRFDGDQMQLINLDELVVRGVDATVEASPGRVQGGLSWSFQDAFSPRLGSSPLDFLPQHRAAAWVGGAVVAGVGARARLRYESAQIDRGETLAAHTTVDVSLHARLGGHLMSTIRVDNVSDERYLQRAGVYTVGRVISLAVQGDWD